MTKTFPCPDHQKWESVLNKFMIKKLKENEINFMELDLESLITDSNRSIATTATTTSLRSTGVCGVNEFPNDLLLCFRLQ